MGFARFCQNMILVDKTKLLTKAKSEVYEYKNACDLPIPKNRDMELVQSVCAVATEKKPILDPRSQVSSRDMQLA